MGRMGGSLRGRATRRCWPNCSRRLYTSPLLRPARSRCPTNVPRTTLTPESIHPLRHPRRRKTHEMEKGRRNGEPESTSERERPEQHDRVQDDQQFRVLVKIMLGERAGSAGIFKGTLCVWNARSVIDEGKVKTKPAHVDDLNIILHQSSFRPLWL